MDFFFQNITKCLHASDLSASYTFHSIDLSTDVPLCPLLLRIIQCQERRRTGAISRYMTSSQILYMGGSDAAPLAFASLSR